MSELSYGVVSVILCLAGLVEHRLVTDGRTDRRTDRQRATAWSCTALAWRRAVRKTGLAVYRGQRNIPSLIVKPERTRLTNNRKKPEMLCRPIGRNCCILCQTFVSCMSKCARGCLMAAGARGSPGNTGATGVVGGNTGRPGSSEPMPATLATTTQAPCFGPRGEYGRVRYDTMRVARFS